MTPAAVINSMCLNPDGSISAESIRWQRDEDVIDDFAWQMPDLAPTDSEW